MLYQLHVQVYGSAACGAVLRCAMSGFEAVTLDTSVLHLPMIALYFRRVSNAESLLMLEKLNQRYARNAERNGRKNAP